MPLEKPPVSPRLNGTSVPEEVPCKKPNVLSHCGCSHLACSAPHIRSVRYPEITHTQRIYQLQSRPYVRYLVNAKLNRSAGDGPALCIIVHITRLWLASTIAGRKFTCFDVPALIRLL